ncbi:MAG: hypothetical protein J0L67_02195 [Cytophagales bacterium]|nr:hypothetical protein [Cytophagales bacterium]
MRVAYQFRFPQKGLEVSGEIPSEQDALKILEGKGFSFRSVKYEQLYGVIQWSLSKANVVNVLRYLKHKLLGISAYNLSYPMVAGYSDVIRVPAGCVQLFGHYCGVFASANLFVELAIPTALNLASNKVVTEADTDLKGIALWLSEDFELLNKYQFSLKKLQSDFPSTHLFIHPIKLSKWK